MGQAAAKAIRNDRLERERALKVEDRTTILAIMTSILYPKYGDNALFEAKALLTEARLQAEKDIPTVEE